MNVGVGVAGGAGGVTGVAAVTVTGMLSVAVCDPLVAVIVIFPAATAAKEDAVT
jgi:hypothetical protein